MTQFRFCTDFSHGNEVACLCDLQRSILGALSNHKHSLFQNRYFENGPLEPEESYGCTWEGYKHSRIYTLKTSFALSKLLKASVVVYGSFIHKQSIPTTK